LPFEILFNTDSNVNGLVRVARLGKLGKLIKIFRLVRLVKIVKKSGKIFEKFNAKLGLSIYFEKIGRFLIIYLLLCHFIACIWIFTADLSTESTQEHSNWITTRDYDDMTIE
jgi:hypothetical protein